MTALATWTADTSQQCLVDVELHADLSTAPGVAPPPSAWTEAQVRGSRKSLIMPTPTIDSRGRPS